MKIWCVEDDASIRDIEIYTLQSTGFEAEGFENAASFCGALETSLPDLILLDIMLPDEDGFSLLKKLRKNQATCSIPVIMATAKGQEYDKIQSLDAGADDYLVKPFGMMEMVSRIKAVLRRCKPSNISQVLRADGLSMDLAKHTVMVDGERVQLTLKEYEILRRFLMNPGILYTRERLFNEVWSENIVGETRTVDMHITTLRQKIGSYGKMIETVRGIGYRFEVS